VCQNDTVVLEAFSMRGDTVARWTIDGVEIADSSAILPWCFTTAGNHSITALLHGRCITDWCDTIRGCIEVNAMALTILPDTFCIGAPCLWHGRTIDTTGLYTDTLRSAAGCDSVVQQRIVLVEPGDISITADRTQICEGDTILMRLSLARIKYFWSCREKFVLLQPNLKQSNQTDAAMDTPKVLTRDEALQLVREYKRVISPRFDGKAKVMMVCWSCKREGRKLYFYY
jgi:hypothetical protein